MQFNKDTQCVLPWVKNNEPWSIQNTWLENTLQQMVPRHQQITTAAPINNVVMVQTGANPTPRWIKRHGRAHELHSALAEPWPGHGLHQVTCGSFGDFRRKQWHWEGHRTWPVVKAGKVWGCSALRGEDWREFGNILQRGREMLQRIGWQNHSPQRRRGQGVTA